LAEDIKTVHKKADLFPSQLFYGFLIF